MPSKYCEKLPRCKNAWWCTTDYKPSKNVKCFDAMTNAERIRAMSDEELAEFLDDVRDGWCYYYPHSVEDWLDLLKDEVTG
jgi:hypothetical protein